MTKQQRTAEELLVGSVDDAPDGGARPFEVRAGEGRCMSSPEASMRDAAEIQWLLREGVRAYAAACEAGQEFPPFDGRVTATEALVTVSAILAAVDVEVFELGLWNVFGINAEEGRDGDCR